MLSARKATSSTMAARDHANNTMIKNNQALQSEYMKKQDQSLAILADGVDRLDDMAKGINDEIRQQDAYVFVLFDSCSCLMKVTLTGV